MRKEFIYSLFIFVIVGIVTFFSRKLGWYNNYWYTDVILHFLSGVGFGLIWLGLDKESKKPLATVLACVSFAVFGSVLWEYWEYFGWHITPSHTRYYIPEMGDTLSDTFFGLIGGLVAAIPRLKKILV